MWRAVYIIEGERKRARAQAHTYTHIYNKFVKRVTVCECEYNFFFYGMEAGMLLRVVCNEKERFGNRVALVEVVSDVWSTKVRRGKGRSEFRSPWHN